MDRCVTRRIDTGQYVAQSVHSGFVKGSVINAQLRAMASHLLQSEDPAQIGGVTAAMFFAAADLTRQSSFSSEASSCVSWEAGLEPPES